MPTPHDIPDLAIPDRSTADAEEVSRCLERAAKLVQDFTEQSAAPTLAALLAAARDGPKAGAKRALALAKTVSEQTGVLDTEVARFLALTRP